MIIQSSNFKNGDFNNEHIGVFREFFKGRIDVFAQQQRNGSYFTQRRTLTDDDIFHHLQGRNTYGIYPILNNGSNTCWHTVIDIDVDDIALVKKAMYSLLELGINRNQFLVEFSGKKGYHIWFRFEKEVKASKAKSFGKIIVTHGGLNSSTEVFPKQDSLEGKKLGSLIKLPLCVHRVSGSRSYFLDENLERNDDWEILKKTKYINQKQLDEVLKRFGNLSTSSASNNNNQSFDNGMKNFSPCFQRIYREGVDHDIRDKTAFSFALHLKNYPKLKWSKDKVESFLIEWDKKNRQPLGEVEIRRRVQSAFDGVYTGFGLEHEIVKPYCTGQCPHCELRPVTITEILNRKYENHSLWGEGLLDLQSKMIISGAPFLGKSFFVLNLGISLASGKDFLGFQTSQKAKVLYIQAENSEYNLKKRLKEMTKEVDVEGFSIITLRNFKLDVKENFLKLKSCLDKNNYDVLIFDPLASFNSQEENSADGMMRFLGKFDELISEYAVSVVIVHHHGINGKIRGSTAISGWVDSHLSLKKEKKNIKLSFALRNAENPHPLTIKRNANLWFEVLEGVNNGNLKLPVSVLTEIIKDFSKTWVSQQEIIEKIEKSGIAKSRTVSNRLEAGKKEGLLESRPSSKGKGKEWKVKG